MIGIAQKSKKAVERRLFITCLQSIYRDDESYYTEKLAPQPHVVVALGFLTKKRDPSRPDV
jgi:hypothetical protein